MKDPKRKPPPDLEETGEADDAVIGRALVRSLLVIVVLALVGGGAWYWFNRPAPQAAAEIRTVAPPKVRDVGQIVLPRVKFTNVADQAGIDFVHVNGAFGQKLLPETMGSGGAALDYDNDGDQDLLLINSGYWPGDLPAGAPIPTMALYRNDGGWHFENVTAGSGLDKSFYGMGVAVGDYDNDGRIDVFVTAVGQNHLFHNEAGGFVEVTPEAGVAGIDEQWSTGCAWLDYDNDGDLDLFVANYVRWSKDIDLAQDFRLLGVGRAYGPPKAFEGSFPYLYRNDGGGEFTDVSQASGIQVQNSDTGVPVGKSLGVSPVDLDDDGWIDLVVANDTVQNFLFHNLKNGTFEEIGIPAGMGFDTSGSARGGMGCDVARFRNSEHRGIAIGNFSHEMTALYVSQGNLLQFSDEANACGLGPPTRLQLTFGVFFLDCDLDGRLDLFTANGHLEQEINKVDESQQYEQAPLLLWNCGLDVDTEFLPLTAAETGDELVRPMAGRGSGFADFDGDGDLDVFVTACGGRPRLLRNDQALGHHWVRLKLVGSKSNRDAIGAWIELHAGDAVQWRQVMPTRSYLSQSELPVTIGLGQGAKVDKLVVHWPNGYAQEVSNVKIDQAGIVEQPR